MWQCTKQDSYKRNFTLHFVTYYSHLLFTVCFFWVLCNLSFATVYLLFTSSHTVCVVPTGTMYSLDLLCCSKSRGTLCYICTTLLSQSNKIDRRLSAVPNEKQTNKID